jgi:hypothetical protein
VHPPDGDGDALRLTASCANEVVDSRAVPAHHRAAFLHRVVQRYGRVLGVTQREVLLAAQGIPPDQATDQAGEGAAGAPSPVAAGGTGGANAHGSPHGTEGAPPLAVSRGAAHGAAT